MQTNHNPQPDLSAYLDRAIPYTEDLESTINGTRKLLKAVSMLFNLQKTFEEKLFPEWIELASTNEVFYYHDLSEVIKTSFFAMPNVNTTPVLSIYIWQNKPVIKIENLKSLKDHILNKPSPNPLKPLFYEVMGIK